MILRAHSTSTKITSLLTFDIAAFLAAFVVDARARRRGAFLFSRDIRLPPRGIGVAYMFTPATGDAL